MTAILGLSAYYHDSAAALLVDGRIVAAAQEERFTRVKHDHGFPAHAIDYCLGEAALTPAGIDYVAFYDKPLLKFDRLLETYLAFAPVGFRSFAKAMPLWLEEKLHLPREMRKRLPGYRRRFVFPEHHESHAASAFFPSPFEEAAVLTLDGVGEWATASFGSGRGNRLELSHELHFPHSLGLLYSAFTYFIGFKVNSGEYKLMGLAPYGEPRYVGLILEKLVDLKPDGSLRLDLSYFNYCQGLTMTSRRMDALFGGPPRRPESPLTQREMDIARSVQEVTEEVMLRAARHVHERTGLRDLCLAGGVALNCVGNGRILREGPFERLWIQPAAGDAGGALGAALFVWHQLLDAPRAPERGDAMQGALLGPEFSSAAIRAFLETQGAVFHHVPDPDELCTFTAGLLAAGRVVGWYQGRMEFGPRALGSRSILGDPRLPEMQRKMNLKIKFRESFRPFAPSVLAERCSDYFELDAESPYMLLVADVATEQRLPPPPEASAARGLDLLGLQRSKIPAVTHVDHSARIQTVDRQRHGRYWQLLRAFEERTGCGVLINTSFNVRGEPIVCTPEEAYRCFLATDIDALVLGDFVLVADEQSGATRVEREEYLAQFALD
ncbi:MAG TPA: carbamoyltransferase [Thermoanaerobaculia bacterium]|nr:carbamoyltransferase [Thermoanaerobaculia bacterium]